MSLRPKVSKFDWKYDVFRSASQGPILLRPSGPVATLQLNLFSKSTKFLMPTFEVLMSKEHAPFDRHLSYALAAAHRVVSQSLNARLKKHGIQIEAWRVMECLDANGKIAMGELAKRALLNPPALSKLVDRMVSDGLVHRQISLADQRQVNLLLTPLGRRRMLQIRDDVEDEDQSLTDLLGGTHGETLIKLLSALT